MLKTSHLVSWATRLRLVDELDCARHFRLIKRKEVAVPLLPQLKPIFEAQYSGAFLPTDLPPAELRQHMHAMIEQNYFALAYPQEPVISERDFVVPVDGGEIRIRMYRDDAGEALLPCHVYYHSGGFFLGTLEHSDSFCRTLARSATCAVVSVDYRLAPEHRFPIAAEDSYAALCWVAAHAAELGINPGCISIGGCSAGGNLAAVVALMARDRKGPDIISQVLEIPVLDFTSTRDLNFPEDGIEIGAAKPYAPLYLRDEEDASNPLASPLLATSLANLPPALVLCAEYDQLQPEGKEYARRLADSGVSVVYRLLAGEFHGSQGFDTIVPSQAAAYRTEIASFLCKHYAAAGEDFSTDAG